MHASVEYDGGFRPGDMVNVVDGTFAGMTGRVVDPDEAEDLRTVRVSRPEKPGSGV